MANFDREEVIVEVARLMWRKEMSIGEFYELIGVDLENIENSDPADVVSLLAGVFTGWKNPPNRSNTQPIETAA